MPVAWNIAAGVDGSVKTHAGVFRDVDVFECVIAGHAVHDAGSFLMANQR